LGVSGEFQVVEAMLRAAAKTMDASRLHAIAMSSPCDVLVPFPVAISSE